MNKIVATIAGVIHNLNLQSSYKIYHNGTIILSEHNKKFLELTKKHQLFDNIYMFYNENDENSCIVSDTDSIEMVNQLYKTDIDDKNVIFDSLIDDISNYDVKMYLFVNNDLKMGKGKIAGQVGHAVGKIVERCINNNSEEYALWKNTFYKKIVCKATYNELIELKSINKSMCIMDMGKTQIEANSLTVVGFEPMFNSDIPKKFNSFKLL